MVSLNKKLRAKISIGFIIGVMFLTVLFLKTIDENNSVKLRNYSSAKEFIEKGWIPKNISKNSKDIFLVYNIDTNIVNLKYLIPTEEIGNILSRTKETKLEVFEKEAKPLNIKFISEKTKLKENKDGAFLRIDRDYLYIIQNNGEVYIFSRSNF